MFYELLKPNYNHAAPLYQMMTHSQNIVRAVFEGNHVGRIFVDDPVRPSTSLAALTCQFFYLTGRTDNASFNQAMKNQMQDELIPQGGDLLIFPATDAWRETITALFSDFSMLNVTRNAFTFVNNEFISKHSGWQKYLPDGYTIQRYDRSLSEGVGLVEFWGSLDHFLEHGVGFAVKKDDEVISRCHSVLVGNGEAEISIETAEPHRRHGFATLAACAFIDYCTSHNLNPVWSCWDNNIPSLLLAQKLGFMHPVKIPAIYIKVTSS